MRTAFIALMLAAGLSVLAVGCASQHGHGDGHDHSHAGHHGYHEHPFGQMPPEVQAAVRRDYPNAQVVSAGSEFSNKDETPHYHIKLRTADGKTVDVEYDQSGRRPAH